MSEGPYSSGHKSGSRNPGSLTLLAISRDPGVPYSSGHKSGSRAPDYLPTLLAISQGVTLGRLLFWP